MDISLCSGEVLWSFHPHSNCIFLAMARTNPQHRARSPKKARVEGMKDYPEDKIPNPPPEAEQRVDEDMHESEDEENRLEELLNQNNERPHGKQRKMIDEHGKELDHDQTPSLSNLLHRVFQRVMHDVTARATLRQLLKSYDNRRDLVDTIAGHFTHILPKIAQNGAHQDGFQGIEKRQTTSFAGHPAVLHLDGDKHELGRIGHLGGEWSVDCWHQNQNGRTICLS